MSDGSKPALIGGPHEGVVGHAPSEELELLRQCIASGLVEASAIVAHGLELKPAAATPRAMPHEWPAGLLDRIKAAEQRIADNHAPRRIPADPHGDVDLVLAEVRYLIEGNWPPFWIKPASGVKGGGNAS